jgi:hypothetical protein
MRRFDPDPRLQILSTSWSDLSGLRSAWFPIWLPISELRRSLVPEKTPRDVGKAELSCRRLNAPRQKIFVPDRTGLQDTTGLNTTRKHQSSSFAFIRPHGEQTLPRQPDGTISGATWGVEQRFTARIASTSVSGIPIFPLECQLLRTNAAHRD